MSTTRYRLSKYTTVRKYNEGYLLLNRLTGARAYVYEEDYIKQLEQITQGGIFDNDEISDDIIDTFCVREDTDELKYALYRYNNNKWSPRRLELIIFPTRQCNLKCVYCYEDNEPRRMSYETTSRLIEAITDYHSKNSLQMLALNWFGGEPLLEKETLKRVNHWAKEFCDNNNISLTLSISTNGYLLDEDTIEDFKYCGMKYYQITVDGLAETHDKQRILPSGQGTWKIITDNLLKLKASSDYNFLVHLRVNYGYEIVDRLEEFIQYVKMNLDNRFNLLLHPICAWGGTNDQNLDLINADINRYLYPTMLNQAISLGLNPSYTMPGLVPYGLMCYAASPYHYTIDTDGTIRKCTLAIKNEDEFNVVGSINEGYFKVDHEKLSNWVIIDPRRIIDQGCEECNDFPACYANSCPLTHLKNKTASGCVYLKGTAGELLECQFRYYEVLQNAKAEVAVISSEKSK